MKIALTIAGSDSGGGAGIQADLKTFHQFGVHGVTAITAVTAQNTRGVKAVEVMPRAILDAQLSALAEDLAPDAVKTGMLATAALAQGAAASIGKYRWRKYVLDPVMVATSGDRLLDGPAESTIAGELIPLALLVTPNRDEAAILSGCAVADRDGMRRAADVILKLGAGAVLIKGGHLPGTEIFDLLVTQSTTRWFTHPRLSTNSTHGTGCTLSAAITAGLALGWELAQAVETGIDYLQRAIAAAPGLGKGHGPVNHAVPAIVPPTDS